MRKARRPSPLESPFHPGGDGRRSCSSARRRALTATSRSLRARWGWPSRSYVAARRSCNAAACSWKRAAVSRTSTVASILSAICAPCTRASALHASGRPTRCVPVVVTNALRTVGRHELARLTPRRTSCCAAGSCVRPASCSGLRTRHRERKCPALAATATFVTDAARTSDALQLKRSQVSARGRAPEQPARIYSFGPQGRPHPLRRRLRRVPCASGDLLSSLEPRVHVTPDTTRRPQAHERPERQGRPWCTFRALMSVVNRSGSASRSTTWSMSWSRSIVAEGIANACEEASSLARTVPPK